MGWASRANPQKPTLGHERTDRASGAARKRGEWSRWRVLTVDGWPTEDGMRSYRLLMKGEQGKFRKLVRLTREMAAAESGRAA